jgi:hypothetical protein
MKLLALAAAAIALGAPSKTVRLAIIHTVHGCHAWQSTRSLGAATTVKLPVGGRLVLRVNCPMDFDLSQVSGPRLALGDRTFHTGTTRTIAFPRRGTYVLRAVNLQTSDDLGLETLGADEALRLTVRVS